MVFFQDIAMPRSENLVFQNIITVTIDRRGLNNWQNGTETILLTAILNVLNVGTDKYSFYWIRFKSGQNISQKSAREVPC